ncbi:MAG: RNA chaperone Hfq [Magnetococcus sp. YQC-3]
MPHYNQNSFLEHGKQKKLDAKIRVNGKNQLITGVITSFDQYTIIVNDHENRYARQVDFSNEFRNKMISIQMATGETFEGKLTSSDMFVFIINDSIMLFKNSISSITSDGVIMIFKSNINSIVY